MANNLHVSYDLYRPGQNYEKVIERIKKLGSWGKVHQSFWYVNSTYTARQAADFVAEAMDASDKVYVVDASNNVAAWNHLPENVASHIRDQWTR
jgi:phage tail sheath protein FI